MKKINGGLILDYQKSRIEAGISGRTVNLEVGLLRRILKKYKHWARIAEEVRMLPEQPKEARVLTPDEKKNLLEMTATKPEWQIARCAAVLALNTTMRSCEIRGLRWKDIDWEGMTLTIRRASTKTNAGARTIPLIPDSFVSLMELRARAEELGSGEAEHFVLPACEHGHFDATKPMKNWRTAWRTLTRAVSCPNCGLIQQPRATCRNEKCRADIKNLRSVFHGLRFHDLRHQAITELAERGLSDQTIMSIAGHVSRDMLNHYSHIRLDAKREALESLQTVPPNKKKAAIRRQKVTSQSTSQKEKPTEAGPVSESKQIGANGFEPSTSCSQGRRASQAALRPVVK